MIVIAPLEIILALLLCYGLFFLVRKLLNSRKLDKVIEEVVHPQINADEVILDNLDRAAGAAIERVEENESEINRRLEKNEKLRRHYGG